MLKIRLRRMGSRQDPFYRIVVSDSRSTPNSSFVESLGTYNPGTDPGSVRIDVAKAEAWIKKGAHPSETVRSLLVRAKGAQV
ncbi:MAG TPA: 30S ribosomal protein S16 [Candidatus Methylomirabilis sp.]|nr:30S ribosomal protein S16 [Candidatus Methylomirabilis sp.]